MFTSNIKKWANDQTFLADRVEQHMAAAILNRAVVLAPKDTGNLHASGVIKKVTGGRSVKFGDVEVPYARIHELGGMTGRNYATKIIPKHYLTRAGNSVGKENIKKYVDMSK